MKYRSELVILLLLIIVGAFLRIWYVTEIPPGLYIDEVSAGYNAYSIITQGVDEHGRSYPLWFEAFGEFKMPVFIYLISLTMALIGKSDLAVRLPSVLAGIITIPALYFLTRELLHHHNDKIKTPTFRLLPLVSAGVLALTPWHMHLSRGGFEATIALLFFVLGTWLTLRSVRLQRVYGLIAAAVLLILTIYTYQAYRMVIPLFVIILGYIALHMYRISIRKLILPVLIAAILLIPAFLFFISDGGMARFAQASAFGDHHLKSTQEKFILYPQTFITNYLSFFSFPFLFNQGDGIGRHQMPNFGLLWKISLPFLIIGCYVLSRMRNRVFVVMILAMLFIVPIPAAMTVPSPHALRVLPMVIPLSMVVALGLVTVFAHLSKVKIVILTIILLVFAFEIMYFTHYYVSHYPKVNIMDWGAGYKGMVQKSQKYHNEYDIIAVDKNLGLFEIYFKFYDDTLEPLRVDPSWKAPTGKKVLLVRPNYNEQSEKIIDRVYLPNQNNDIFAEFWKL